MDTGETGVSGDGVPELRRFVVIASAGELFVLLGVFAIQYAHGRALALSVDCVTTASVLADPKVLERSGIPALIAWLIRLPYRGMGWLDRSAVRRARADGHYAHAALILPRKRAMRSSRVRLAKRHDKWIDPVSLTLMAVSFLVTVVAGAVFAAAHVHRRGIALPALVGAAVFTATTVGWTTRQFYEFTSGYLVAMDGVSGESFRQISKEGRDLDPVALASVLLLLAGAVLALASVR